MKPSITIELVNFKCWTRKIVILEEGVNFLTGKSGSGKSTIPKAIYFVLYGGRKFKDIANRRHKTMPTHVVFHYVSTTLEYKITRSRPSETLVMLLKDSNGIYELKDTAAQAWINANYGTENIWLASSLISRKKPHFLLDSNNADKMELLERMSFGESAQYNQPDYYLCAAKNSIAIYNEKFKQTNENIKIQQSIRNSIIARVPLVATHPYISKEDQTKMIEFYNIEIKNLEALKNNKLSIQTRIQLLEQLEKLPKYDKNINEIDIRLKELTSMKEQYEMKKKLINFNKEVIDFDRKILESDNFLYGKYLNAGWKPNTDLQEFINKVKKDLSAYKSQQQLEKKNIEIKETNSRRADLNKALTKAYNKQMSDYNEIMKDITDYHSKRIKNETKMNEIKKDTYNKFAENDDLSSNWLIPFKIGLTMGLKELICPNCKHGLLYQDGKLELGTIDGSNNDGCENIKKKLNEKLSLAEMEFIKRKKREVIVLENQEFMKLIVKQTPDLPEQPKFYDYDEPIPFKVIIKPNLEVFEIPNLEYDKFQSLWNSIPLIDLYLKCVNFGDTIGEFSVVEIEKEFVELNRLKLEINKINENKVRIETIISTLAELDPDIDTKINTSNLYLADISQKIQIANSMREIEVIDEVISNLNKDVNTFMKKLANLEHYHNKTEKVGVCALQEKINDLNTPLGIILDDLFEEPIDVKLSSYKELKNGNSKLQVNFKADFKGLTVNNLEDFSDGEEGRISLALLMAFSRTNNNPFVIVDEVLSAMNSELAVESVDVIKRWTPGKFVIHICHSVAEGHHCNTIHFDKTDI